MDKYGIVGFSHRIQSPWWSLQTDGCLTFLRQAFNGGGGVLRVYIEENMKEPQLMRTYTQDISNAWYLEEIPVSF